METPLHSEMTVPTAMPPETAVAGLSELDQLMADLDSVWNHLPVAAIRAAQQNRAVIIPRLIEAIRSATRQTREGSPPKRNAHFFALFLLTECSCQRGLAGDPGSDIAAWRRSIRFIWGSGHVADFTNDV